MRLANAEMVPLHSLEMEMGVLGSMILSDRAAEEVLVILKADDFYRPAHRDIFRAIDSLVKRGIPPDLEFVVKELKDKNILGDIGNEDYVIQVAEYVPSPANALFYAQSVREYASLRQLEEAGRSIVNFVHDPDLDAETKIDKAEQLVFAVGQESVNSYFKSARELAKEYFVDVDQIIETGEPLVGAPSGFADLDKMTTGFYGGELIVVGARPSMGKTALVLDFALQIAKRNTGAVAIFSLEMSGIQLMRRMVSMVSGVNSHVLKSSNLAIDDYKKLADACDHIHELPIQIDDSSGITPIEMRGKCRRLKAESGLSLIVIDYLQLMHGTGKRSENRTQEISDIARAIKAIAKDLQVPVIALSQLNRGVETREDKRPVLSDIRESGSIEAEADIVMLLYRDAYYKAKEVKVGFDLNPEEIEEAEVIIAKNRNGPTGKVILGFQPTYARYRNLYGGAA